MCSGSAVSDRRREADEIGEEHGRDPAFVGPGHEAVPARGTEARVGRRRTPTRRACHAVIVGRHGGREARELGLTDPPGTRFGATWYPQEGFNSRRNGGWRENVGMVGRLDDAAIDARLGALTGWSREGDEIRKEYVRAGLRGRHRVRGPDRVPRRGRGPPSGHRHPVADGPPSRSRRTMPVASPTLDFDLADQDRRGRVVIFAVVLVLVVGARGRARRRRREEPRSVADGDRAGLRARLGPPRLRRRLPAVRSRAARRAHQARTSSPRSGPRTRTGPGSGTSSRRRSPRPRRGAATPRPS